MSFHKTESKTFEVRWRENGKQRSQSFKRQVDAKKFDALKKLGTSTVDALRELGFSSAVESALDRDEITFATLADIWIRDHAEVHKTPSSVIRDKQILRDFLVPVLGSLKLSHIKMQDVVRLQSDLCAEGKSSAKSVNNILGLLHKIFDDTVDWGYVESNPAARVKNIKCPEIDYQFWTFSQRDKFLKYVKNTNFEVYRVVCFTVNTGLRKGEVEGLLRDCVDFERREIIVKRSFCDKTKGINEYTKGKNIRRVPMNNDVFSALEFCRDYPRSQPAFDIDFHNFSDVFVPLQQLAGVSRITFHDLRHTFASLLAMSGVSVFFIQKLLGHADIKITSRYMHMAPDQLRGTTDALLGPVPEKSFPLTESCLA